MKSGILLLLLCFTNVIFSQQDTIQLIKPTGNYSVGTVTFEWTDESRLLNYTSHAGDKRTIIVQIWYPAEMNGNAQGAPYNALSQDYDKVLTNSYLRPPYSNEIKKSNLILFAPGRGTERFLYTTLIEELASHGYVVASVDMPEIGYVLYQDGLVMSPSGRFKPPRGMMGGPYEKVDKFFEEPTEMGYLDLEFVLQKIEKLNMADSSGRFTERIDVDHIGVFGHSLGGRIAGEFTARNKRVKGYISMEGIPPRDVRYGGMIKIPIAMLCSSGTWPYAKENYFSLIDNRNAPAFMIEMEGYGHNSVTDNPFIYAESFNYQIDPRVGLEESRKIVLEYFNSIFKNQNTFQESLENLPNIKLTEYK